MPEPSPFGTGFLEKEWPFLCACASPLASRERILALLGGRLDWDVLFLLAEEHSVLGLVTRRLEEASYTGVPVQVREKLQARMRAQHIFALGMAAELFRILADFSKANIEGIPVKGPVVSLLAYGDPAARSYGDLDLLLRHRDIQSATQRMLALGFEPKVPVSVMRSGKIPGEYVFRRPGTQCLVELHTERTFRHYPRPMRVEELFARRRQVLLDGKEVPALNLEDELVLNCIHGVKDFWARLMWISDVAALVARHPEMNWEKARRAAAEVGAERMLHVGIWLGISLFAMKLPDEIAEEIQRDQATKVLCAEIQEWLPYGSYRLPGLARRAIYRMKMGGGGIAGVRYLLRLSLSPTEDDWEDGPRERRSWLWDAVRRPFRLIRKYGSSE